MISLEQCTIENAILCDEVRQEKSNKFILIGVYAGDIVVASLPAPVPISIYLDGITEGNEGSVWLRLTIPGGEKASMRLSFGGSPETDRLTLVTPALEIAMAQEGEFSVDISGDGEEPWHRLVSRKVIQAEGLWSLTPIVSQPPSEQSPPAAPESSPQL